jgi:osmotically inducible protein OsmC
LDTAAEVTMEGGVITGVHLSITGSVSDISTGDFESVTKDAEKNCPISKALSVPITSEAHLIV